MKSIYVLVFTFFVILLALPSWSGEFTMPREAFVKSSYGGEFYFKMLPGDKEHPKGHGILYRIDPKKGTESAWWKISGWYSSYNYVYISPNGEYLVCLNDAFLGLDPKKDELGIAFYNMGKLIKKYSIKDLVKDISVLADCGMSLGQCDYLKEIKGFTPGNDNYTFTIVTIDNIEYQFNVPSGDIISLRKLG